METLYNIENPPVFLNKENETLHSKPSLLIGMLNQTRTISFPSIKFCSKEFTFLTVLRTIMQIILKYSVIQKDGLNFVSPYFLNYAWYVNDLHNSNVYWTVHHCNS